ncbi:MAG: Eco57I restriction-modification methylase domain-containing protein [Leadbetterella sp.]|nr:Eco57I restriction-modification methylase domain-containing protein [Leadbetterella sp.]
MRPPLKPRQALNPAFLKIKPQRQEIEVFKAQLIYLLDHINEAEHEEFNKNSLIDFLKKTGFDNRFYINTKGRNDLVVHIDKSPDSALGVIIETKKPGNKTEMPRADNLNCKAVQELVLYFLRERITLQNSSVKYLIATDVREWYVFDAQEFEKVFAQNKELVKQFKDFEEGRLSNTSTDFFYKEIAKPIIEKAQANLEFTYFNIRDYEKALRNADKADDSKLIVLYKLLSAEHLLKLPFANDSNSLDKRFYSELLHIIGLEEVKDGGKKLIHRKTAGQRNGASLLENTIEQLESHDKLSRLGNLSQYGANTQEVLFNVGLELCITWINRVLFLKLLEAQLMAYHGGNKDYAFLNTDRIKDYDKLNKLFFQVLAKKSTDRSEEIKTLYGKIPYLNSSLFEPTELEHTTFFISNLEDDKTLPILSNTVLKEEMGKKQTGQKNAIAYMFEFLEAYDFSSEGKEEIQEDNKNLINASVLGLIFEKINGYKDGSFFTPGFITMYMCRETIRRAVVQKFNETKGWQAETLDDLYDKIEDRKEANEIVNQLKIVDPAVGSGHFLVSALNEIIAVKHDLKILQDRSGKRLKEYDVKVVNDELIILDEDAKLFDYKPNKPESQRIQETLFHEKQTIIENCLFGVDINPNSVKICRLRLWIELLKNAYYNVNGELETLPNIDINIKSGNSLISRFALDADLSQALKKSKYNIDAYKIAVDTYRNAKSKDEKREMERLIETIKGDFRTEINKNDPKLKRLDKLSAELYHKYTSAQLFDDRLSKAQQKDRKKLQGDITKLSTEVEEIKSNRIYENAFEWRFEFPEVLDAEGTFLGFDVVIGNPPYIRQEEFKDIKDYLLSRYVTFSGMGDLYVYFVELSFNLMKESSIFTFIMPNKWMQAEYGKSLRNFFLQNCLIEIVDFGDLQVFEEATTYPCILIASKKLSNSFFAYSFLKEIEKIKFKDSIEILRITYDSKNLSSQNWILVDSVEQKILDKIKSNSCSLENYILEPAKYGVKTGLTDVFIIDEVTKQHLINEDFTANDLIKPVLRGKDMKPWISKSEGLYLISTFPSLNIDIDKYSSVKKYLLSFGKNRLNQSGEKEARKKTSNKWFETQDNIAYWHEFEKPKIMYQVFQVKPCFIFDDTGLYCNNSMWIIPKDDVALVGLLNSKMGWYLISKYCTPIQNGYQLIWKYFGQIPIPNNFQERSANLRYEVKQILRLKKQDSNADTSVLEAEIDRMVYELYGLTEEEIAVVEGSLK